MTETCSQQQLAAAHCVPCEGGVPALSIQEATLQLLSLPGWELLTEPNRIRKAWKVRSFAAGVDFFRRVCDLAEAERHHPDLHLTGYRHLAIEIWTHAISGLSLNDFILAAKIDELPIDSIS